MIEQAKQNHAAQARYVLAAERLWLAAREALHPLERVHGDYSPVVRELRESVHEFRPHVAGAEDGEAGGNRPERTPAAPLPDVPLPWPPLDFKPWLERGVLLAICGIIGLLAWLVMR